jgi:hypothetical protein
MVVQNQERREEKNQKILLVYPFTLKCSSPNLLSVPRKWREIKYNLSDDRLDDELMMMMMSSNYSDSWEKK